MSVPTVSWDETSPAGSQAISLGDNRIRELKTQIREVVDVDHKFDSSGQDADMGKHNQISFLEQADIGTGAEGKPILGAQTVGGKAELVFTDEDDNDIQITSAGYILISSGLLPNDTYLKAHNNAGDGTVDLIKANTSDVAVLPDGSELATSAAPTADADIANKKYVDDQVGAVTQGAFSQVTGTSDITTTSNTPEDMTDMSIDLSGAGEYLLIFSAILYSADGNTTGEVNFDVNGTDYGLAHAQAAASSQVCFHYYVSLEAGDHTFKVQWCRGGGSATVYQNASTDGATRVFTVLKIA